ncbi:hypothetical protein NDU88_004371 [Pleurodeles waltl]|uniref:Uncharacterized protein n=1 Tax=Pleurodeles waltl TaxID=8319 RepID=A0AAV7L062_PLEWA|nr:hypothetical protein NDU88_004371 [Pleurodeles waltl]
MKGRADSPPGLARLGFSEAQRPALSLGRGEGRLFSGISASLSHDCPCCETGKGGGRCSACPSRDEPGDVVLCELGL